MLKKRRTLIVSSREISRRVKDSWVEGGLFWPKKKRYDQYSHYQGGLIQLGHYTVVFIGKKPAKTSFHMKYWEIEQLC